MRLPAACVPGTLCDARVFEPLLTRLDLDAVHVPLVGRSVDETAAALLAAAPPRFVAIGFSLGGSVVLEALRRAPERLIGAVLIASHGEGDRAEAATERARQRSIFGTSGPTALIDDLSPRYSGYIDDPGGSEAVRATQRDMASGFDLSAFEAQSDIAASRRDRLHDGLAPVPMLLVGGALDPLCPPQRVAASAAALGAAHATVARAGHFVLLERPSETATAISGWLDRVRSTQATPCA